MIYANDKPNYTECAVCGHETKYVVQDGFGVELAMCPTCLRIEDRA